MSTGGDNLGNSFKALLDVHGAPVPATGEEVKGKVIFVSKNEVLVDLDGYSVGVIRGSELKGLTGGPGALAVGDDITAKVIDLENERGQVELSLREFGEGKAWGDAILLCDKQDSIEVRIDEANKGGLMVRVRGIIGFLPVSQLAAEHYPRVEGGDKNKILKALKKFIGKTFKVKVIAADPKEAKLIVSEKAAWEDQQKARLYGFKKGDIVEGEVKATAPFGVFFGFGDDLEGLIHISELSWKKVEHPNDIVAVGDRIKAQILEISGTKVFLSLKRLLEDPWKAVAEKYQVGQVISGKVTKVNPFGAFIDMGDGIQGLAHISELVDHKVADPNKILTVGEEREFRIIDVVPDEHRIGLSLKALGAWPPEEKAQNNEAEPEPSGEAAPVEGPGE